jgi:putative inorganic carbon (HCO3(-)) transporter
MPPLRDLVLTGVVLGSLPVCFTRPWIGILVWSWLAYMNPHRLVWGFAWNIPFALMVAVATLAGFALTRDRRPFLWTRETITLALLWVWLTITTVFAIFQADAWEHWNRVSKIFLMTFLTVPLFQSRERLRWLLLVIAGSMAFYALKGARFVLFTGGQGMVLGAPGNTFISSNNAVALALNMCLPLFLWLAREEKRRWLRMTLYAAFFASMVSVLFTYSRGGVLGLAVVLAILFLNRRNALALTAAALVLLVAVAWIAPDKWMARMETIRNYEQDSSAMQRLNAWRVGLRLAHDRPILGGGFSVFNHRETFALYDPNHMGDYYDAHSIYFNLLGEHGWIGLGLFAVWVTFSFRALRRLRRLGRKVPELQWAANYADMLRASIIGYLVTGAFLSVAYFDLAYHLLILVPILDRVAKEALERQAQVRDVATAPTVVSVAKPRIALTPWRLGVR